MKTDPNHPATGFSTQASDALGCTLEHFDGLTKLEAFTMAAMEGLCSQQASFDTEDQFERIGQKAVKIAEATIKALNESKP